MDPISSKHPLGKTRQKESASYPSRDIFHITNPSLFIIIRYFRIFRKCKSCRPVFINQWFFYVSNHHPSNFDFRMPRQLSRWWWRPQSPMGVIPIAWSATTWRGGALRRWSLLSSFVWRGRIRHWIWSTLAIYWLQCPVPSTQDKVIHVYFQTSTLTPWDFVTFFDLLLLTSLLAYYI